MATPQEIQKLLNQLERAYQKLGTANPFKNFDASKVTNAETAVAQLEDALEGVEARLGSIGSDLDGITSAFARTIDEIKNQNSALGESVRTFKGFQSIAQKLSYDYSGISKLSLKELETLQKQYTQRQKDLELSKKNLESEIQSLKNQGASETEIQKRIRALEAVNNELEDEESNYKYIGERLAARITQEQRINELMGIGGAAIEAIQKSLDKLGFGGLARALGLDEVKDKMREVAEQLEEASGATLTFSDRMKVLKSGLNESVNQLGKNLTDPLVIAGFLTTQLISAFKSLDDSTGKLAKNFGISYDAALGVSDSLNDAANSSYLLNVTTQGLTEAFIELNNQFGTFAAISEESLVSFTRLTQEAGVTNDAAKALFGTTVLTGKELEASTSEFLGQATALAASNGLALNQKQLLEEVKNISKATLVTLGGQPEELAKAVVAAKALGASLQQVETIASSLLQFESSIQNELEAELLLGRDINLEKARLAALNGDIATVAEEIAKQTGSAAEFSKMNVIQQEALAKSVGMTREDLAKSLQEREALAKLSGVEGKTAKERFDNLVKEVGMEEAKKRLGDEQLANLYSGQNVQERFAAATAKLQEIFVSLAEPLMPVLSILGEVLEIVGPIASFMGQIVKFAVELGKYLLIPFGIYKAIQAVQKTQVMLALSEMDIRTVGAAKMKEELALSNAQNLSDKIKLATRQAILFVANEEYRTLVLQNIQSKIAQVGDKILLGLKTAKAAAENISLMAIIRQVAYGAIAIARAGIQLALTVGKAVAEIAAASALTLGAGVGPILAGAAVGAAIIAALVMKSKKADDMKSDGYGKRTILSPEGSIRLNDKDTIIAGTDLEGGEPQIGGANINLTPLINEVVAMRSVIEQLLTKEGVVYLDSTKVGTATAVATYKTQ